ncbi:MAG TPA: hypothetical protein VHX36_11125 [Candidatus Acidoferrales bacterium]|jgi:hypothetical protein|nr:hypothetical protein [Candidatus Acidoferrales bacterium]
MDEERDRSQAESAYREPEYTEPSYAEPPPAHGGGWLIAAVVVLIVGLCVAVGHSYMQERASHKNASQEAQMNTTIGDLQNQVNTLSAKLNALSTAPPAPAATAPAANPQATAATRAAARRRTVAENRRYKQLQSQLADQQKQLQDTESQIAQDRSDLEGNINSTRDQLTGSIAKTHDELVALEQKGERNYFEFDLTKSKKFEHAGPVMVSLRKANVKHKDYDLAMIVDDNQLSKKHVNLYEPVWIDGGDSQEMQLVVNKIDKDHVHGYVSAPKYSQSASAVRGANDDSSAAGSVSTTSSNGSPNSSDSSSGNTQQPTQ